MFTFHRWSRIDKKRFDFTVTPVWYEHIGTIWFANPQQIRNKSDIDYLLTYRQCSKTDIVFTFQSWSRKKRFDCTVKPLWYKHIGTKAKVFTSQRYSPSTDYLLTYCQCSKKIVFTFQRWSHKKVWLYSETSVIRTHWDQGKSVHIRWRRYCIYSMRCSHTKRFDCTVKPL